MANDLLLQRLREIQRPNIQRPEILRPLGRLTDGAGSSTPEQQAPSTGTREPNVGIDFDNERKNNGGYDLRKLDPNSYTPNPRRWVDMPKKRTFDIPSIKDENGHMKAWGFEEDKSRYADVSPDIDSGTLTWRDYTITSKEDGGETKKFSIGFDADGKIAGVRTQGEPGVVYGKYGRNQLKDFFSQFDRDATRYHITRDEVIGNEGNNLVGQSITIYDSDEDDAPFVPSAIFKDEGSYKDAEYRKNQDKFLEQYRQEMSAKNGTRYLDVDEEKAQAAANGSLFTALGDIFHGRVTPKQYENFVNNRGNFEQMVEEWVNEDDPFKRSDIINKYTYKYGFADNLILSDLIANGLAYYDWGDAYDHDHEGANFSLEGRKKWADAMKENMDYAEIKYNPNRTA